jgi:glutamine synthetase
MCLLLLVQLVAITFDVAIVFMDFAGYLQLKFIVFSFAYAVKLELEFVALNQLVELSKMGLQGVASMSLEAFKTHENDMVVNKTPSTAVQTFPLAKTESSETSLDVRPSGSQSSRVTTLDFITTPQQMRV